MMRLMIYDLQMFPERIRLVFNLSFFLTNDPIYSNTKIYKVKLTNEISFHIEYSKISIQPALVTWTLTQPRHFY